MRFNVPIERMVIKTCDVAVEAETMDEAVEKLKKHMRTPEGGLESNNYNWMVEEIIDTVGPI